MRAKLWYVALAGALIVPDVCAALGDASGQTNPEKYVRWVRENHVDSEWREEGMARDLYRYRNAVVHQSRLDAGQQPHVPRLMFFQPDQNQVRLHIRQRFLKTGEIVQTINLDEFCEGMVRSAREWLGRNSKNAVVLENMRSTVRKYPGSAFGGIGGLTQPFYA